MVAAEMTSWSLGTHPDALIAFYEDRLNALDPKVEIVPEGDGDNGGEEWPGLFDDPLASPMDPLSSMGPCMGGIVPIDGIDGMGGAQAALGNAIDLDPGLGSGKYHGYPGSPQQ
ncbi:hypothetical protein KIPB_000569 [Kipferlia bialata]|uniref:Uncharacterized protein n=1 Tax=Kipferlia bialata TaxID=797122 RepID=A0A9K3CNT4_9EUKA|nr:hypothetical protein KIPB_000569 [Kipferlia bialata]|eukprot:g569.t1